MSDEKYSEEQAQNQLASITSMVKALRSAREAEEFALYQGEEVTADDMIEKIQEDPLELLVRSDWHQPGQEPEVPHEFYILLCTGGPAVRIIGRLFGLEPQEAYLEHQDWGTPWTRLELTRAQEEIVLEYANCFYFGN